MMSMYQIIKNMPSHGLHDAVTSGNLTFLDWLRHPRGGVVDADRQTRQIAGTMDGPSATGGGPEALLDKARESLSNFAFFGVHEYYPDSISALYRTFGWPPPATVPHLNQTSANNDGGLLSAEELDAVRQLTTLDESLYRFALDLFVARIGDLKRQ